MGEDAPLSLPAIGIALALLFFVTAAEASIIMLSRARARTLAGRHGERGVLLHRYVEERHRLLSALRFLRLFALIGGVAAVLLLVEYHRGLTPGRAVVWTLASFVVVGVTEGIAATLSHRSPERWALWLSPLLRVVEMALRWPARVLDAPGLLLARLLPPRREEEEEDDQEELIRLVELEESNGGIEEDERDMIRGVFRLVEATAREIMVPRVDMAAVDAEGDLADVQRVIVERGYSRIPIYEETIDNIVGVVYAKDVLRHLVEGRPPAPLRELARQPYFVPETKKLDELLTELRQSKIHIAFVVDEYGGTAGLVTTEDILEEIVGEIVDEYDTEEPTVERAENGEAVVDGRLAVETLNELFDAKLENDDYDTVAGAVLSELGRVPAPGDMVAIDGLRLEVLAVSGSRVKKVRVFRPATATAES